MTKILIPHGTTPTGYGIKQRRNGALRPLSKCCGRSMERKSPDAAAICRGCGKDYTLDENKLSASLGNDIPLEESDWEGVKATYTIWVQRVIGDPSATLSVKFEPKA